MRRIATALLAAALAAPAAAQAPGPEEIGSWLLTCATDRMTDRSECTLRHRTPVERSSPGFPALALEVVDRGGRLVPVVTARDLTVEGAARALLAVTGTAQLRFPPNRLFEMPCALEGRSIVCAPKPEDAARAAEELARADTALARVVGFGAGSGRSEPAELRLSGTREALARFRARAPEAAPAAPQGGVDARELLQRLQRLFGQ